MFDVVFENLRSATESSMRMQQEMVKKWVHLFPGLPANPSASWNDQVQRFQKEWMETVNQLMKQQQSSLEAQFKTGMENLENAFKVAESKDFNELRTKTMEFWHKSFDCLRQTYEQQMKEFQSAMSKWTELMGKSIA